MSTLQEKPANTDSPSSLEGSMGSERLPDFWAHQHLTDAELHEMNEVFTRVQQLTGVLKELLVCEAQTSRQVIDYLFSSGGKRVRPALFYLSSRMCGYDGTHLTPMAAVCEYIHGASLLHDDVVDNSTLRRGKATANTLWSDKHSVLVGDLIYARASELMAQTGHLKVVEAFARAIRLMSEGELLQMDFAFDIRLTTAMYYKVIHYKTAALLEAITYSAAALAGLDEQNCDRMKQFGYYTGMAFQIIDDTLDYSSTKDDTGKPSLSDLREGKVTLPLILALEKHGSVHASLMVRHDGFVDSDGLLKLVQKYNTVEACMAIAESMTHKAVASLDGFADSKEKRVLLQVVDTLLYRKF